MDWLIVGLIGAAVAIYALVDLSMRPAPSSKKMIWAPIIIVLPIIGPFIYFISRKKIN